MREAAEGLGRPRGWGGLYRLPSEVIARIAAAALEGQQEGEASAPNEG